MPIIANRRLALLLSIAAIIGLVLPACSSAAEPESAQDIPQVVSEDTPEQDLGEDTSNPFGPPGSPVLCAGKTMVNADGSLQVLQEGEIVDFQGMQVEVRPPGPEFGCAGDDADALPDGCVACPSPINPQRDGQRILGLHEVGIMAFALLPDGRIASVGNDGRLNIWHPDDLSNVVQLWIEYGDMGFSLDAVDNQTLVVGGISSSGYVWELGTQDAQPFTVSGSQEDFPYADGPFPFQVWNVAALPNGFVASGANGLFNVWDPANLDAPVAELIGSNSEVLRSSSDGQLLFEKGERIMRWDWASNSEPELVAKVDGEILSLDVMSDGRIVVGTDTDTVFLVDEVAGAEPIRLDGHAGWVRAVLPLADGRIASGSSDGTIRIWTLGDATSTSILEGHVGAVKALVQMPDGRLISGGDAESGLPAEVLVWDIG